VQTVGHGTLVLQPFTKDIHEILYSGRESPVATCGVPSHRSEDRIRELCSKAVSSDDTEFPGVLCELRSAIHQHVQRIRTLAVRELAGKRPRGDEVKD
jgi:hypothetical protein